MEIPETDLLLSQAQEDYEAFRRNAEEAFGVEQTAKRRVDECQKQIREYTRAAEQAVKQGQEADALHLLETKKKLETELARRRSDYETAHENAEELRVIYNTWSSKMDTLERHASMAKAAQIAARMYGNTQQVRPAVVPAAVSPSGDDDLLKKYSAAPGTTAQQDLEALKKKLGH